MPYIKVVKTKAYFKRFQVKYRRRRENKTDYYARTRLTLQDKNKYNSPKYRLVVRKTNKDIIAQIAFATLNCDQIIAAAYGHELPKYGVKAGFKNYSAAYATGLLLARRVLLKLGMSGDYVGNLKPEGKHYIVEQVGERRPFYVLLDIGLNRTTCGAKIFATLKGAADGGLEIPHSKEMKQFPGYNPQNGKFDSRVLRKYIFGGNVADYMKHMKEQDSGKYEKHFAKFIKAGVKPEDLEKQWQKVHKAIRADPSPKKSTKQKPKVQKRFNKVRLSRAQRKDTVRQKKEAKARKQQQE